MPKYSRRRKGSKKSYNKSKKRLGWAMRIKSIGNWFTPEQKDQLLNAGFNKKEINSYKTVKVYSYTLYSSSNFFDCVFRYIYFLNIGAVFVRVLFKAVRHAAAKKKWFMCTV